MMTDQQMLQALRCFGNMDRRLDHDPATCAVCRGRSVRAVAAREILAAHPEPRGLDLIELFDYRVRRTLEASAN